MVEIEIFRSKLDRKWGVEIAIKSVVKVVVKLVTIISYMMYYSCNDTAEGPRHSILFTSSNYLVRQFLRYATYSLVIGRKEGDCRSYGAIPITTSLVA